MAGPDGYSPYPGSINQLLFELKPYEAKLRKTGGMMPESSGNSQASIVAPQADRWSNRTTGPATARSGSTGRISENQSGHSSAQTISFAAASMIFRTDAIASSWLTVRPALTSANPRWMPSMMARSVLRTVAVGLLGVMASAPMG